VSQHPGTFAGEAPHGSGVGWDDWATLHRLDGGGVLHGFKAVRKGTFAGLVRFVSNLPEVERALYMIEKSGDRQYLPVEIMTLASRRDFPSLAS